MEKIQRRLNVIRILALAPLLLLVATLVSCDSFLGTNEGSPPNVSSTDDDEYLPQPDEFVPVEEYPKLVFYAEPEYPRWAYLAQLEGTVWVQTLVDKLGEVRSARVAHSSGVDSFDRSAVRAAYQCIWTPAIQNGQPVACWVTYRVDFKIDG